MAKVPSKHSRDQLQDMQGLLNNLQDWELSLKGKEKKMKSQARGKETLIEDWSCTSELTSPQVNGTQRVGKSTSIESAAGPYNYSKNYNPIRHLSSELISEENNINSNSEKELGNEFFKQKKFNEAIDCYSRSIALSPNAVAYANRAMAYLSIKRFQEAENDCTEALNLDDRNIKAYSRRATSRKELGKLKEAIEDTEFALRLEPQNPEIKKQYGEVKALYEKEILKRVSGVSAQGAQKSGRTIKSGPVIRSVSSSSQKMAEVQTVPAKENNRDVPGTAIEVEDTHTQINSKYADASPTVPTLNSAFGTAKIEHWSRTSGLLTSPQVDGTQKVGKSTLIRSAAGPYNYSKNYNPISHLSSELISEENNINTNSEKELGNEFFKQKKFNEAIDCYSRSIALSPTAVAYANRAMAYLKIKRFQEAENDCTEALNLDDRHIKAYSRRSTSRKELGKLKEAIEDAEFALRLEPQNPEIKKQYGEVKALYEKACEIVLVLWNILHNISLDEMRKDTGGTIELTANYRSEILKRVSGATGVSAQGAQKSGKTIKSGPAIQSISSSSHKVVEVRTVPAKENNRDVPGAAVEVEGINMQIKSKDADASLTVPTLNPAFGTAKKTHKISKQELGESVQELAARAAGLAKTEAAKNISAPNSAYQFEVLWRGLSGDRNLQTHLLRVTSPAMLPRIFKNALSAPMLMDIVRCVATFFIEDMNLAIRYLEELTKVPRFDMIIMCLSSTDKSELLNIWGEVFCKEAEEHTAKLGALCFTYDLKQ